MTLYRDGGVGLLFNVMPFLLDVRCTADAQMLEVAKLGELGD
jgi:hypothetical protein